MGSQAEHWLTNVARTTTEHITHTILANMVQQFEQFIDQADVIHKLELSLSLGSEATIPTPLLQRLCHLLEIVPASRAGHHVFTRLRRVAETCIQNHQETDE